MGGGLVPVLPGGAQDQGQAQGPLPSTQPPLVPTPLQTAPKKPTRVRTARVSTRKNGLLDHYEQFAGEPQGDRKGNAIKISARARSKPLILAHQYERRFSLF